MNIHMNRATETQAVGEIDIDKMKRFIGYCKSCVPLVGPFFSSNPSPLLISSPSLAPFARSLRSFPSLVPFAPSLPRFARSRCAPRLSGEAAEKLSSHFVALRKQVQQVERDNNERSSIPITVR
jgi:DNA replication licensing factor MCM5